MDTKEKHIRENESVEKRERELHGNDMIAESMPAEGRERKRNDTRKSNKLWIWFGVLVLIAILLYWIFSIGIFGDLTASFNG
ncbi:MAG: hypothetical protein K2M67_02260 [Muribaculaceae bacterium]|nr:hypothetical protein [Bacteroides sp.]MDE7495652.1 hypothetical protein [Muribaculaceae bacterium]